MRQGFHSKMSQSMTPPTHTFLSWHGIALELFCLTVQMCDLMWGGWECINNHDDISVGHTRSFALEGRGWRGCRANCVPPGSPAEASLTPTRQLQRPCERAYGFRLHTYCVTSLEHNTLGRDLDNGHVTAGFQLQWSVTTASEIVMNCVDLVGYCGLRWDVQSDESLSIPDWRSVLST